MRPPPETCSRFRSKRSHRLNETVGVQRDGVDLLLDEELSELGVITRRLPANPDLDAGPVRTVDRISDHALHRFVALVEKVCEIG